MQNAPFAYTVAELADRGTIKTGDIVAVFDRSKDAAAIGEIVRLARYANRTEFDVEVSFSTSHNDQIEVLVLRSAV